MADVETDLLTGLAQYLHDNGAATYRPTGGYLADETAVVFGELPTSPDRVVALTVYGAVDEGMVPLSQLRVQVMLRGSPNNSLDVGAVAGPVFDLLQGLEHLQCGTAHVNLAQRVSRVPLGVDESKRSLRADNYAMDVDMPATAGRPG